MARAWFFLVLLNASSFSATRLSISCLTLASSSWARSTLFSSISRVASASSRAPCSSSFSVSSILLCLSRAWMERPRPPPERPAAPPSQSPASSSVCPGRGWNGLGLLQSALQLLLLSLQHPPLFVQGVDGTASLTELIKQILDLVSEVLVLPLDNVQLLS